MADRLTRITTGTGDDGTTGLGDGSRVDKDGRRVEAYGTVDELNAALGSLLACDGLPEAVRSCLVEVQQLLFDVGSELCIPGRATIEVAQVRWAEGQVHAFNADLPPLANFVLPGGSPAAAACHVARTVCRRAERRVVTLSRSEPVNPHTGVLLNRLSDLLFVVSRVILRHSGRSEVLWAPDRDRA